MLKEKDLMKSEGSEEKPPTACVSGSSSVKWVIMVVARAAVPGNNNTIAVLALAVWCLNTGTLEHFPVHIGASSLGEGSSGRASGSPTIRDPGGRS